MWHYIKIVLKRVNCNKHRFCLLRARRIYIWENFTFASPFLKLVRSENVLTITWRKIYGSGSEIGFYYFFKFQRLVYNWQLFECFIFEHFHSASAWPRTVTIIWDFQFLYASLIVQVSNLVPCGEVNQFPLVNQSGLI